MSAAHEPAIPPQWERNQFDFGDAPWSGEDIMERLNPMESLRILAISGNLRALSSHKSILRAMADMAPPEVEIILFEGIGAVPAFNPDDDTDATPEPVTSLRGRLRQADGVIICTPEYAFGVPGALKNALDWTVSSAEFYGKPVALVTASPTALGGDKAHAALLLTLSAMGAHVPEGGALTIPALKRKVSATGEVTDLATAQALQGVLDALLQAIRAQRAAESEGAS